MVTALDSTCTDAALLRPVADVLQGLANASSPEQVARVAALHARRFCHADGIGLNRRSLDSMEHWPQARTSELFQASVTLTAECDGPLISMSVHWCDPHSVTPQDMAMLDVLTQAVALALKNLPHEAESGTVPGRYMARERARFFDFQRQVRSLLAVVRSIVRHTVESARSTEDYAAHLEGRLGALARVQGLLLRAPEARVDLEELVRSEFLAQSIVDERTRISGPRILLASKAAETLGLAFHELTMNAIKFGALSGLRGAVQVLWQAHPNDPGSLQLEWREQHERAAGAAAAAPQLGENKGFGFELIEKTLPYELGAHTSLALTPGGLRCVIVFPMQSDIARVRADSP